MWDILYSLHNFEGFTSVPSASSGRLSGIFVIVESTCFWRRKVFKGVLVSFTFRQEEDFPNLQIRSERAQKNNLSLDPGPRGFGQMGVFVLFYTSNKIGKFFPRKTARPQIDRKTSPQIAQRPLSLKVGSTVAQLSKLAFLLLIEELFT